MAYTLEIKQIVDYPRVRIHRELIQKLLADESLPGGEIAACSLLWSSAPMPISDLPGSGSTESPISSALENGSAACGRWPAGLDAAVCTKPLRF